MSKSHRLSDIREKILLKEDTIFNTEETRYPGNYPSEDDSWSLTKFLEKLKIKIINCKDPYDLTFDLIGVTAPLANAFRRVLLVEIPSMAIDRVFIYNNTSLFQDEVLAHRLGLIPIYANPHLFHLTDEKADDPNDANPSHVLMFNLKIKCFKNPTSSESSNLDERYSNRKVYSTEIKWIPLPGQLELFKDDPPRAVHDDILIAKLGPGQEIECTMHCMKGIGQDHVKFSPVGTASYRLLPDIKLLQPITGDLAVKLQKCFSPGVIAVSENDGIKEAHVKNARLDTCSREVFNHEELKNLVEISRIRDHFIFSIESTGAVTSSELFLDAAKVLKEKCQVLLKELMSINDDNDNNDDDDDVEETNEKEAMEIG